MFTLPENCTASQALELIREHEAAEMARVLVEYLPYAEGEPETMGEPAVEEPSFEPSDDDRSWLAPLELADEVEGWQEYAAWAEHLDEIHRACGVTDRDIAVATGCVG